MIRFHLDECVAHGIADGLSARGADVTTTTDAGLVESSDSTQFDYAVSQGRVLITCDRDFLRISSKTSEHPGVVYFHPIFVGIGEVVRFCDEMSHKEEARGLAGRVFFVPFNRTPR